MSDGSWVGVDLHARFAVAGVLDGGSGELRTEGVPAASGSLLEWLAGLPGPVRVPGELEEQARDLVRAREDSRADLMRARHRLSKLLLRHELLWERSAWTREHDRGLASLRFEGPLAVCLDESYAAVLESKARRDLLDRAIAELAAGPRYADTVARLCCLRGVSTLTALALTVELGDWTRLQPASLGAFLGLVPSE